MLSPHPPWNHLKPLPTLGPVSLPRVLSQRSPFHRQVQCSLEATACECHPGRSVPQRGHSLGAGEGEDKDTDISSASPWSKPAPWAHSRKNFIWVQHEKCDRGPDRFNRGGRAERSVPRLLKWQEQRPGLTGECLWQQAIMWLEEVRVKGVEGQKDQGDNWSASLLQGPQEAASICSEVDFLFRGCPGDPHAALSQPPPHVALPAGEEKSSAPQRC